MSDPAKPPAVRHKRLDAFEAVFQVAQLTVKRSLKGWRSIIALLVVALPAGLAALVRGGGADPMAQERFFYGMLSVWHFAIATPFVALIFATAFPWPESDEGTLTYWFTSPIPRWTVLLGRYAAALLVGSLILCVGVLAIGIPLALREEATAAKVMQSAIACTLLAYPAYLALFQLVATVFRKGLVFGVVFIFLENIVSVMPSATIVRMTIVFYVRSQLWPSVPPASQAFAKGLLHVTDPATTAQSLAAFLGVAVIALGLSLLAVQRIEYRGKTSQPG